ncbi:hypothetical protein [Microbacterium sp. A93]|uniref:hypothetical protein n=1 Tax=Microbacterium sp. A93 TaxID=3450716 RepID=UPI003F444C4C
MELRSDVRPILKAHISTLRNHDGRIPVQELLANFIAPIVLGAGFGVWQVATEASFPFGNLLAGLAILFGFFLALTTFVFSLRRQVSTRRPLTDLRAPVLIDELFVNCEYAVIVSGAATVLALLFDVIGQPILGSVLIVALAHIFVLVMMCLKRLNRAYEIHKEDLRAEARAARDGRQRGNAA